MADLIDRLSGVAEDMDPARDKIPIHPFLGAMRGYAQGNVSRAEISTQYDLQGAEATQATAIADAIDAEVGVADKVVFVLGLEGIMFLVEDDEDTLYHAEDGSVDKTRVQADGGF